MLLKKIPVYWEISRYYILLTKRYYVRKTLTTPRQLPLLPPPPRCCQLYVKPLPHPLPSPFLRAMAPLYTFGIYFFLVPLPHRHPTPLLLHPSVGAFQGVVVEEFLDEIDVAHEHAAAAVAVQVQRVQRVALGVVRLKQVQVRVPLVSNHLCRRMNKGMTMMMMMGEGGGWALLCV